MAKTPMIFLAGVIGILAADTHAAEIQPIPPKSPGKDNTTAPPQPRRGPGRFGGPIELKPDDKPAFDDPPAGFEKKRDDIPHGKLEMVEYDSKTVGTTRKMQDYTPPGYSK